MYKRPVRIATGAKMATFCVGQSDTDTICGVVVWGVAPYVVLDWFFGAIDFGVVSDCFDWEWVWTDLG
jgi:hypothetical protein